MMKPPPSRIGPEVGMALGGQPMTKNRGLTLILVLLLGSSCRAWAQDLVITNVSVESNVLWLGWTSPTDRYIVAQSVDPSTSRFAYVGSVLSTNPDNEYGPVRVHEFEPARLPIQSDWRYIVACGCRIARDP